MGASDIGVEIVFQGLGGHHLLDRKVAVYILASDRCPNQ